MPKPSLIEANTKQRASAIQALQVGGIDVGGEGDVPIYSQLCGEGLQVALVCGRVAGHDQHHVGPALGHCDHRPHQPFEVLVDLLGRHGQDHRTVAQPEARAQLAPGGVGARSSPPRAASGMTSMRSRGTRR